MGLLSKLSPSPEAASENGTASTSVVKLHRQEALSLASENARRLVTREIVPRHHEKLAALESLTADAVRVRSGNRVEIRRLTQAWQARALNYYDMIPEIHFASGFYARGMSGLRLYVGELQDDGEIEESENPEAIDLLARVQDRAGGRETLLGDYGRLAFTAGECFLLWTQLEDNREIWEIVSTDELRVDVSTKTYYRLVSPALSPEEMLSAPDDAFEPLPGESIAYRLWTPHPRFTGWADSPMRACLDLCEELVLLTLVVRARVMSRLAGNGILLVPDEMSPEGDGENEEEPGEEDLKQDPFAADLIESTVAPIENPGTAAAQVPLIVRGPQAALAGIQHLTFRDVEEEYRETGLRDECIRRIATGLDMPPEALLGMSGANHWNAWIIDEQTWKVHLKPVATAFCGNLTEAYLRPTAKADGISNWDRLVVCFDEASIVVNPDRGKDAEAAYDRRAIGKATLRESLGFSDDDAPSVEDLEEMLFVATGATSVDAETPQDAIDEAAPVEDAPADGPPTGEDTPREEPPVDESQVASATLTVQVQRVLGAAEAAMMRCRELAGSRLIARMQGQGAIADEIKTAPKTRVAHLAGPAFGPAETLVEGGASTFIETAIELGVGEKQARILGEMVEVAAARTLYDDRPGPLSSSFVAAIRP